MHDQRIGETMHDRRVLLIGVVVLAGLAPGACKREASGPPARVQPPPTKVQQPPASRPAPRPDEAAAPVAEVPAWDLGQVANLGQLGVLTARQRELLTRQGFFLAPQPTPPKKARRRATHLFHIYERNDYIAFPSLVTADLAIDATHAYFNAVLREVEERVLVPRLRQALRALLTEAEAVRAAATGEKARAAAGRAAAFWGVPYRLLGAPAREVPAAVRADVERVVAQINKAEGRLPVPIVRAKLDLTQMRPRGHYTRSRALERYFRAMSWLGMASFPVQGPDEDVVGLALVARSWLGSGRGQKLVGQVLEVTTFFAGGPDAADLASAAARLKRVLPDAERATADALVADALLAGLGGALKDLPAPRIQLSAASMGEPPQVRVMGRRAFEDAVAMQAVLGPLMTLVEQGREAQILPRAMGALGSAAVLGSDLARAEVLAAVRADQRDGLGLGVERGRAAVGRVAPGRWDDDAYHGTLHALRPLLAPPPAGAPNLLRTDGWRRRTLQAFAAGWAELRHDTILYGEQLGAECDAPEPPPPPGWVEPIPDVYRRLAAMVRELDGRLKRMGIRATTSVDKSPYYRPLTEKAKLALELLDLLRTAAERELAGKPLTRAQLQQITLIGGRVEWLLISLADTDLLAQRDQDMAVVADVFTWRPTAQVVEVAVAHPDLIYGIIPGPRGKPVVARGAVMSYREFLQPARARMTDEAWRKQLAAERAPARPAWVGSIYAEPVRGIRLRGSGVDRCGPSSGAMIEL